MRDAAGTIGDFGSLRHALLRFVCQRRRYTLGAQAVAKRPNARKFGVLDAAAVLCVQILSRWPHAAAQGSTGILSEIFSPQPTCRADSGSLYILRGLIPNITRTEVAVELRTLESFNLDKCSWEVDARGSPAYICRGPNKVNQDFAVRYTGYLRVVQAGEYDIELDSEDGARLVIGNGMCPGTICGTMEEVMNLDYNQLRPTKLDDNSYGVQCDSCTLGGLMGVTQCWFSVAGCEPFRLWVLENDGGFAGCKQSGRSATRSRRYLNKGLHPFRLEYFRRSGGEQASIALSWRGPDSQGAWATVPNSAFRYPSQVGLMVDYYAIPNTTLRLPLASEFGGLPQGARHIKTSFSNVQQLGIGAGAFSKELVDTRRPTFVRWTGHFVIIMPGLYQFRVLSDDGSRITLGGRGIMRETVIVNNDGVFELVPSGAEGEIALDAGSYPIRIEYLFIPPAHQAGAAVAPRPPGINVLYSGPDTGAFPTVPNFVDFFRNNGANFITNKKDCSFRNFFSSFGLSTTRDCSGKCFDSTENFVGDWSCDDGASSLVRLNLLCAAYLNDGGDCETRIPPAKTTPQPQDACAVSAAPYQYRRHNDRICKVKAGPGLCEEATVPSCQPSLDDPTTCNFVFCCRAKLFNLPWWGSDCISYGALKGSNCTTTLTTILKQKNNAYDFYARTMEIRDSEKPASWTPTLIDGLVYDQCAGNRCNEGTLAPTTAPVACPALEASNGISCFEGPWDVLGWTDPFVDCQNAQYQWNFCLNQKTNSGGMPFSRCCGFAYVNSRGEAKCKFMGLPGGTCERAVEEEAKRLAVSAYSRISNTIVLTDCTTNMCNNPKDEDNGCPASVIERPPETAAYLPEEIKVPSLEVMLVGAPPGRPPNTFPWYIIVAGIGGILLSALIIFLVWRRTRPPPKNVFYEENVKVLSDDTFVTPVKADYELEADLGAPAIGVVKPRPFALAVQLEDGKAKPRDLARRALPNNAGSYAIEDVNGFFEGTGDIPDSEYDSRGRKIRVKRGRRQHSKAQSRLTSKSVASQSGWSSSCGEDSGNWDDDQSRCPTTSVADTGTATTALRAIANCVDSESESSEDIDVPNSLVVYKPRLPGQMDISDEEPLAPVLANATSLTLALPQGNAGPAGQATVFKSLASAESHGHWSTLYCNPDFGEYGIQEMVGATFGARSAATARMQRLGKTSPMTVAL